MKSDTDMGRGHVQVCSPSKTIPILAQFVTERDGTRAAALDCLSSAHSQMRDDIWMHLSRSDEIACKTISRRLCGKTEISSTRLGSHGFAHGFKNAGSSSLDQTSLSARTPRSISERDALQHSLTAMQKGTPREEHRVQESTTFRETEERKMNEHNFAATRTRTPGLLDSMQDSGTCTQKDQSESDGHYFVSARIYTSGLSHSVHDRKVYIEKDQQVDHEGVVSTSCMKSEMKDLKDRDLFRAETSQVQGFVSAPDVRTWMRDLEGRDFSRAEESDETHGEDLCVDADASIEDEECLLQHRQRVTSRDEIDAHSRTESEADEIEAHTLIGSGADEVESEADCLSHIHDGIDDMGVAQDMHHRSCDVLNEDHLLLHLLTRLEGWGLGSDIRQKSLDRLLQLLDHQTQTKSDTLSRTLTSHACKICSSLSLIVCKGVCRDYIDERTCSNVQRALECLSVLFRRLPVVAEAVLPDALMTLMERLLLSLHAQHSGNRARLKI